MKQKIIIFSYQYIRFSYTQVFGFINVYTEISQNTYTMFHCLTVRVQKSFSLVQILYTFLPPLHVTIRSLMFEHKSMHLWNMCYVSLLSHCLQGCMSWLYTVQWCCRFGIFGIHWCHDGQHNKSKHIKQIILDSTSLSITKYELCCKKSSYNEYDTMFFSNRLQGF